MHPADEARRGRHLFRSSALAAAVLACCAAARAQPVLLDAVVISGSRIEERVFDVPAAIDAVDGERLRDQQPRVNLSEALVRVPGLLIQNRQNLAQDLQVSSRGFGARATFGVRGVRLIQDGIPITMPDGQGQTALFDLDNARRVEVLRGPFAALYGNSSGGVIHLLTEDGPPQPALEINTLAGSDDTWRAGARLGGQFGPVNVTANVARFSTEGYRVHSAATRDTANMKLGWSLGADTRITFIGNALEQPDTDDPLGLTQAQLDADRRQAGANAIAFDTHKRISHRQGGVSLRHRLGENDTLEWVGYAGMRRVTQFLAIPVAFQGPTSSGGVVDLDRDFNGTSIEWRHVGRTVNLTLGISRDSMSEVRTGFVNDNGVQGAPRRDETDRVTGTDQYAIASWTPGERWKLSGGFRHTRVRFRVDDRYVDGTNPDDSGQVAYGHTSPVAGLLFKFTPRLHGFVSAGRGFETPTFAELAYRPGNVPGLHFALRPARSRHVEAGVKSQLGAVQLSAALFRSDTRDEVVPATSSGGRNSFSNADKTRRAGLELSVAQAGEGPFSGHAAYTLTRARFDKYVTFAGVDLSGNAIPGVARHMFHGELAWRHAGSGFKTALELRSMSKVLVNDANSASAGSYTVLHWRGGFERTVGRWTLKPYLRIDNLLDEDYVGSVIVNEANQRYFEPAPGRAATLGLVVSRPL
jgi:iron complex outermembrane receptor protein